MGCAEGGVPLPQACGRPSDINSSFFLARKKVRGMVERFFSTLLGGCKDARDESNDDRPGRGAFAEHYAALPSRRAATHLYRRLSWLETPLAQASRQRRRAPI